MIPTETAPKSFGSFGGDGRFGRRIFGRDGRSGRFGRFGGAGISKFSQRFSDAVGIFGRFSAGRFGRRIGEILNRNSGTRKRTPEIEEWLPCFCNRFDEDIELCPFFKSDSIISIPTTDHTLEYIDIT